MKRGSFWEPLDWALFCFYDICMNMWTHKSKLLLTAVSIRDPQVRKLDLSETVKTNLIFLVEIDTRIQTTSNFFFFLPCWSLQWNESILGVCLSLKVTKPWRETITFWHANTQFRSCCHIQAEACHRLQKLFWQMVVHDKRVSFFIAR